MTNQTIYQKALAVLSNRGIEARLNTYTWEGEEYTVVLISVNNFELEITEFEVLFLSTCWEGSL